ncbi:ribosome maturation factor RimP [Plantactinospora siamensis]|uniref:Ribosome maturation factor RimP n=1 Tax=Plantactinospora siamensis TaxID=555372 RepID=A0ABV6NSZ8_9ACTN
MTQRGRASSRSSGGARPGARAQGGERPRPADRPRVDQSARRQRLREVVEPVITDAGYDLEDLSVSRAGRRHVVRVIVDGDGGVSLDAVAEVSRRVSRALDEAEETGGDLLAGEYQLEVSSPGVDRPLTLPRHWRRNIGRLVRVTARGSGGLPAQRGAEPVTGDRQVAGRVLTADEDGVTLEVAGESARWSYPDLGPGRVQVEFTRLDEPDEESGDEAIDEADDADGPDDVTDIDDFDDPADDEDVEDEER